MKANIILTALAAAIMFMGAAVGVQAQDNANRNQPTSTQHHMRANRNNNETETGCLEKGSGNDYTLSGQDGSNWQVTSDAMNLGTYVGKEVFVAGTESGSAGRQANASRQTASAQNQRAPIDVLDLAVVNESCQAGQGNNGSQGGGL